MARKSEFYKGKRKKKSYAFVPFVIVLAILTLVMVSFYGMQKYAVVTKDGVSVELPVMSDGSSITDSSDKEKKTYSHVEAELVLDPADYSDTENVIKKDPEPLRAIFVSPENLNVDKLQEYQNRLKTGNALVIEMKPRSGELLFTSASDAANSYGMSAVPERATEVKQYIDKLKEQKIYLVAQISCLIDSSYGSRSTTVTLKTPYGASYTDKNGVWLDPYNQDVRNYVVQMCRELYALGFDEVVLADVMHPVIERDEDEKKPPADPNEPVMPDFVYSREMTTTPTPVNAVCGFAAYVADQLKDRTGLLSIYTNSPASLVKADKDNGQDATFFMKLFDRVYYPTDKAAYKYNIKDIEKSVLTGSAENRFVPVVINYLPNNFEDVSWVLIDKEIKEDN